MKTYKLGEVCELSKGKTITRATSREGEVPVIAGGLGPTYFHDVDNRKPPVITISASGANAGFVNYWDIPIWASDCTTIVEKPGSPASIGYIYKYLQSRQDFINSELRRGSAQPHVYPSDIASLEILLPSLEKQQKIVEKLDTAFVELDSLEMNLGLSMKVANELFGSVLSSELTRAKSESWQEVSLKEICDVDWGNTKLTKSSYVDGGTYLAVSAAGADGLIDHFEHEADVPVLSAIGAQCGRMFFPGARFTAIKNTITLTPKNGVIDGKFLYYLFTHVDLPQRGAGQPFISKGDIEVFTVRIPKSLETQREIVGKLDGTFSEIELLRSQFKLKKDFTRALRQSLLSSSFKGEVEVA